MMEHRWTLDAAEATVPKRALAEYLNNVAPDWFKRRHRINKSAHKHLNKQRLLEAYQDLLEDPTAGINLDDCEAKPSAHGEMMEIVRCISDCTIKIEHTANCLRGEELLLDEVAREEVDPRLMEAQEGVLGARRARLQDLQSSIHNLEAERGEYEHRLQQLRGVNPDQCHILNVDDNVLSGILGRVPRWQLPVCGMVCTVFARKLACHAELSIYSAGSQVFSFSEIGDQQGLLSSMRQIGGLWYGRLTADWSCDKVLVAVQPGYKQVYHRYAPDTPLHAWVAVDVGPGKTSLQYDFAMHITFLGRLQFRIAGVYVELF